MAISFSCQRCGKKLKAPDTAVGKSSKCPGCGSTVTCPEPVYEAELIEAPPGGPNPFDDLDTDKPYAMTAEPAEAPAGEVRRPCPMCGEMIIASAAKCRFCGEIFDKTLKQAGKGGKKGKIKSIASAQRNLLICFVLQVIANVVFGIVNQKVQQSHDPALSLVLLIDFAVLLAAVVGGIIYTYLLGSKLYSTATAIFLSVLTIVPCLGLIVLLTVNQKATQLLRDNGYEVGLFGAKAS